MSIHQLLRAGYQPPTRAPCRAGQYFRAIGEIDGINAGAKRRVRTENLHPEPLVRIYCHARLAGFICRIMLVRSKRAMGLEPTTASLEGWHSAIELRPRVLDASPCIIANRPVFATFFGMLWASTAGSFSFPSFGLFRPYDVLGMVDLLGNLIEMSLENLRSPEN